MSDCYIVRRGGAGGGGKIKVITVASESELPSGADGTIASVSAMSAGAVYVQGTAPDNPAAGDVWVLVDASGDNVITLGNVRGGDRLPAHGRRVGGTGVSFRISVQPRRPVHGCDRRLGRQQVVQRHLQVQRR